MKNLKYFALVWSLIGVVTTRAQFVDDFSDGDITTPAWEGNTSNFIVNGSFQLQLQGDCAAGGQNYLSAPVSTQDSVVWTFFVNLNFDPSSSNYARVYLQSTNSDLMGTLNGYFLKIGEDGTGDVVHLYRQDGLTYVLLCDGITNIATAPILGIKVVRSNAGEWKLYLDATGGTSYNLENSVTDVTYNGGDYFGFYCKYTSTRCDLFYFDDIVIDPLYVDVDAPVITGIDVLSPTSIKVHFNENLETMSAETESFYTVDGGVGNPINALQDPLDHTSVNLTFLSDFPEATTLTLSVGNISDESGNAITLDTETFSYYTIHQYDVVISEIYADIDPQIGLPLAEYVELYNTSAADIDLEGMIMHDATSESDPFPSYTLPSGGYVILCDDAVADLFTAYPNVLAITTFPSLNNDGDDLQLFSAEGNLLHRADYSLDWYDNAIKEDGGWSLEMIDPQNPCQGDDNWTASTDANGGTPGTLNSVNASNPDDVPPGILNAYPSTADTVFVFFDEPVEYNLITVADFNIDNGIGVPSSIIINADVPDMAGLVLSTPLSPGIIYTLTANTIQDCSGNIIGMNNSTQFGLPESAVAGDVVLNEILFNPLSDGVDYVEIYNNSNKIIDLSQLTLAELDLTDTTMVSEFGEISATGRLFFPGSYMCITLDVQNTLSIYFTVDTGNFIIPVDMPNFSDAEGIAVIYDQALNEIDHLHFFNDWHYALLSDENGVSLERVNYDYPTQDPNNWHSAAADVHFGTPGYQNSDFGANGAAGTISVDENVFSPDGDGYHDLLVINYATAAEGYSGIFKIFNAQGKLVKELTNTTTLSREGFITWDGINDDDKAAPMGIYIIYAELYNDSGTVEKHKVKCTLVRKQ